MGGFGRIWEDLEDWEDWRDGGTDKLITSELITGGSENRSEVGRNWEGGLGGFGGFGRIGRIRRIGRIERIGRIGRIARIERIWRIGGIGRIERQIIGFTSIFDDYG